MKKNNPIADKAAGWIANRILKVQNKFANVLGKISASWKRKQQLLFLYFLSVVLGGLSVIAIIKPFDKNSKNILSKPAAIRIPMHIPTDPHVRITETEIKEIHDFKKNHDSLLAHRPGLRDSLEMVEQLYYSQKK